jgi:hypothetical protein
VFNRWGACAGNLTSNEYLQINALGTDAMHAEPIAVLDALKLASLARQSVVAGKCSPRRKPGPLARFISVSLGPQSLG